MKSAWTVLIHTAVASWLCIPPAPEPVLFCLGWARMPPALRLRPEFSDRPGPSLSVREQQSIILANANELTGDYRVHTSHYSTTRTRTDAVSERTVSRETTVTHPITDTISKKRAQWH
ncbi:hypothetical protein C8Q78DRAFT_586866 [Trametes maxima]|nr:hypothetical protein C8Q78DRAFT_586866 [Trametes maxima]